MKYINKKLPLMEVGKEIDYSLNGVIIGAHCYDDGTLHCTQADFNLLLKDGFIEEVKPREWLVLECDNPGLLWESEPIKEQLRKNPNLKFIKVREVIE